MRLLTCMRWRMSLVLVALFASLEAKTLYLVGGSSDSGPEKFATILYKIEDGKIRAVKELANQDEGSQHIHLNYEAKRLVVVNGPEARRRRLSIVDLEKPDQVSDLDLGQSSDIYIADAGFLSVPGSGSYYYLYRWQRSTKDREAVAVRLADQCQVAKIPGTLLKYRQCLGFAGSDSEEFEITYDSSTGGITISQHADGPTDLVPPIPPALRPVGNWARMAARNQFMTVVGLPGKRSLLYSEKTGWTAPFQLGMGSTKAIGPWLTVRLSRAESNTVTGARAPLKIGPDITRVKTGRNQRTNEQLLNDRFMGKLVAYNVENGKSYGIETGDANSEVLWIDESSVYYRVNGTLYLRAITDGVLGAAQVMAAGDEIWDVHWAFWSK